MKESLIANVVFMVFPPKLCTAPNHGEHGEHGESKKDKPRVPRAPRGWFVRADLAYFDLAQKTVLQSPVNGDDVAGRFREPGRDEQEDGFGLVFRLYRRLRQCSFRVEVRQLFTQGFG